MGHTDNRLMSMVDETTRLAGSNKMELLLFTLGGKETYGINVFKVREVCETPPITRTPNMPHGVEGITSLRGAIIPIINLGNFLGIEMETPTKVIITEFSGHTQGFLAKDVDRITRVSWDQVKAPQGMLSGSGCSITAITQLPDGKLVSILDVEQLLHDVIGEEPTPALEPIVSETPVSVFFADDSAFARKKIVEVLDKLGVQHQHSQNGLDAFERLQAVARRAERDGVPVRTLLSLILVDAEMPEMDGYVLTKRIKSDRRFDGVPVVMHSSLSSVANRTMGQQVGVDAYVAKFDAAQLAATIRQMIRGG